MIVDPDRKCVVSNRFSINLIRLDEVLYLKKQMRKVLIVTADEVLWEYGSIAEVLSRMDGRFYQCHRSFAINLGQIRKMSGGLLFMNVIGEVSVGRKTYYTIKKAFKIYGEA